MLSSWHHRSQLSKKSPKPAPPLRRCCHLGQPTLSSKALARGHSQIPRKSLHGAALTEAKNQSNAVTSGKLPFMHFCKAWTERIKWPASQSCPRWIQEWKSSCWCCSPCPPRCQVWPLKQWSFFQQEALVKVLEFFRAPFKHEGPLTWPGSSCCAQHKVHHSG